MLFMLTDNEQIIIMLNAFINIFRASVLIPDIVNSNWWNPKQTKIINANTLASQ